MSISYLWIGLGGAAGAVTRVALMRVLPGFIGSFPLKLIIVNVLGCLLLGALTELMAVFGQLSISMRHFLVQGFLGGFTTFSAFALEYGLLYNKGFHMTAVLYTALSVILSLSFFFFGLKLIKFVL